MATLTVSPVTLTGTAVTLAAAAAGGDKMAPGDRNFLMVTNGGSTVTVTIDSVTASNFGGDEDVIVSVAGSTTKFIGPFPASRFANGTDGLVHITYSGVTSVTVAAFTG